MVCSFCQGSGHNYSTCSIITLQEKEDKIKENKEKKEAANLRKIEREQRLQNIRDQREQNFRRQLSNVENDEEIELDVEEYEYKGILYYYDWKNKVFYDPYTAKKLAKMVDGLFVFLEEQKIEYEVHNKTDYDIVLYSGNEMNEGEFIQRFAYMSPHSTNRILCLKSKHTIVAFPLLEVNNVDNSIDAIKNIPVHSSANSVITFPYTSVLKLKMKDYDGTIIIIDSDYKPKKNELEQWKECALKSKFLLDQMHQMTGGGKTMKEYENIEVFLDMVEDIEVPECSEFDKEKAGVPSLLTNVI